MSLGTCPSVRTRTAEDGVPRQHLWLSASRSVLPWVIPATLSLRIKYVMLSLVLHGGFAVVARSLGRPEGLGLSLWEKFSFFRADLLVAFLVAPLGLVVLSRYLPSRWRTPFVVLVSAVISIILYCQLRAFDEVGQFLSSDMIWSAVAWGLHDPSVISKYWNLRGFLVLLGMVMAMAVGWRWGAKRGKRSPLGTPRHWYICIGVVGSCLAVPTIVAWAPRVPSTPFHQSILVWGLRSLANQTFVDTREFRDLSVDDLENQYRKIASAPVPVRDARYWGKAKGCNVLFLVLETTPARVLPADGDLSEFPNLRRLRETSFVGGAHYSTYPETHQAIFSIFSSWYPSTLAKNFFGEHPDLVVPSMIRKLSELGYDTAVYSPYDFRGELDREMYRSLGFRRQVYPEIDRRAFDAKVRASYKHIRWGWGESSIETRTELDIATLGLLKRDLERDLGVGRRFAYLFAPQVSHGPWPDLKGNGEEVVKRGRDFLEFPDQWLGEIMQLLRRYNQLEQTVIVVVGDHGVRAREEDPSFAGNLFGDYSFHVPLLIYVPKAVDHMEKIPWITSHIDIAPTVLSLLGVEQGRNFELGTPVWDPDLAKRITYFFAHSYFGTDGYYSNRTFFMWSHVTDTVSENDSMNFDTVNLVDRSSPAYEEVTRSIRRMAGLDEVWATQFGKANSVRNHIYDRPHR
jgi:membrane-anchored protein YejM (alkaline phosphatase superfamily)